MPHNYTALSRPFNLSKHHTLDANDSPYQNLNQYFQPGNTAFILVSTALVLIMIPGLGFLYSGLTSRKSALTLISACMISSSIILIQWYLYGYSLSLSSTATNGFIGNLHFAGLRNVLAAPIPPDNPLIPELLYSTYQSLFCAVTVAIIAGSICQRGRLIPLLLFLFIWSTLVYSPITYWIWGTNGWAAKWGVLDFAGGGPVEIASGMSALAYSWQLGPQPQNLPSKFKPHNNSFITLGTMLLWFGWLGFNAGSAMGANLRAVMAIWNSNLSAVFAALSWCLLDWRLIGRFSILGWCSGIISGLVAATPTSGFIPPWASVILGICTGLVCNFTTKVKFFFRIDDTMDILTEHGVAGALGLLFNGFFATTYIISLDRINSSQFQNSSHPSTLSSLVDIPQGGFLDGNWLLLPKQIVYILICSIYAFTVSAALAWLINLIPHFSLRVSSHAELLGLDHDQLGEFAYDYVEIHRDISTFTPQSQSISPDTRMEISVNDETLKIQSHKNLLPKNLFYNTSGNILTTKPQNHSLQSSPTTE